VRVLFVISDLGFHGAQKQVVELARELVRRGHAALIYTLNDDRPRAAELRGSGVELTVDQKRRRLDPAVLLRLRRTIRAWRPDIVHGFLYDGELYARLAGLGSGAAVLNSERSDNYELTRLQMIVHRLTIGLVDGVVANSHSGSAFAQRYLGYPPQRMHVVWNGIHIEELEHRVKGAADHRREFFGEGDHRIACMVGHIKPAKDYVLALDTAAMLVDMAPEWRVLFVGDALAPSGTYHAGRDSDTGAYKRAVLARYERLGIGEKVKFAGARPDAVAILAQCDVQLMTSSCEGFPNAVLEGMAVGVPVVSTEYSDIRLILPRSQQIVRERSPRRLARAILAVHREREAIAAEQKRWVRAHASLEAATSALERVYATYAPPALQARRAS
jgi:glycosyltransferase involved in cell wall biosynthesis